MNVRTDSGARRRGVRRPSHSSLVPLAVLATTLLCAPMASAGAWARSPAPAASTVDAETTEIRRTAYGIPHIRAASERGIGYGIGYAYAEDNLCLLADDVITVNGERSLHFGAEGEGAAGMPNLQSDAFFRWLNRDEAVDSFLAAQPAAIRDLLRGYADGYNRYLAGTPDGALPTPCGGQAWLRPITERDLVKLTRRLLIEAGIAPFAQAVVGAAPPDATAAASGQRDGDHQGNGDATEAALSTVLSNAYRRVVEQRGSNALAIGGRLSANGRGMLLGNPHFPWSGTLRFYQMHLTIPGRLDVMGAALPGLPVVNIGFTRRVAWTHTVDTSAHFTLFRLQLDPGDPTAYLVDGRREPMRRVTVTVPVKGPAGPDGKPPQRSHTFYETRYGPVLTWPGRFGWDRQAAYAIRDANADNTRVLRQWHAMAQAPDLDAFQKAVGDVLGIPWVNTIAAGDNGQALYMNVSVIPHVDAQRMASCALGDGAGPVRVLDGSRQACGWGNDAKAPAPGIFAAERLPVLRRTDFVHNANDSAWLANPASPLTGYPGVVSRQDVMLGLRARRALAWLHDRRALGGRIGPDDLSALVMDDKVYAAGLVMDDVLSLCRDAAGAADGDTRTACATLATWDRTASIASNAGCLYFEALMAQVAKLPDAWAEPFDPRRPLTTPRGLALDRPESRRALLQALARAAQAVREQGVSPAARWGTVQVSTRGDRVIPIHGGSGELGVYNVIQSRASGPGRREVFSGTSYVQVVSFTADGPRARTLLTFSQSSNPASPHSSDQTELFSHKRWVDLPFTDAQIRADDGYRRVVLEWGDGGR